MKFIMLQGVYRNMWYRYLRRLLYMIQLPSCVANDCWCCWRLCSRGARCWSGAAEDLCRSCVLLERSSESVFVRWKLCFVMLLIGTLGTRFVIEECGRIAGDRNKHVTNRLQTKTKDVHRTQELVFNTNLSLNLRFWWLLFSEYYEQPKPYNLEK